MNKKDIEFDVYDETLYSYINLQLSNKQTPYKLACFDLDSTLIYTSSGAKFPKNSDDWDWTWKNVPQVLESLVEQDYILCIFTNQKGIKTGKTLPLDLASKLTKMQAKLQSKTNFSIVLVAGADDFYRKPRTGMWRFLEIYYPEITKNIDFDSSFYCGDAAGRVKNWIPGKNKDFSYSDFYFAENLKLTFKLPETLFVPNHEHIDMNYLKTTGKLQHDPYSEGILDWSLYRDPIHEQKISVHNHRPELIIMVGPPASGKTSLVQAYIEANYVHINMDTLRTKKKCLDLCRNSVLAGCNIIIDNTNPSREVRKEYLDLVKTNGPEYYVKAYVMKTPILVCQHLNNLRVQGTAGGIKKIPKIAYNIYKGKYQYPDKVLEGIDEIIEVLFYISNKIGSEFLYKYSVTE